MQISLANLIIIILIALLFVLSSIFFILTNIKIKKIKNNNLTVENEELNQKIKELDASNKELRDNVLKTNFSMENLVNQLNKFTSDSSNQARIAQNENFQNIMNLTKNLNQNIKDSNELFRQSNEDNNRGLINNINSNSEKLIQQLDSISQIIKNNMENAIKITEDRLNKIDKTVQEKLDENITKSINNAFNVIASQLKKLDESLAQVSKLSNDIKTFDNILRGVKTRGNLGEVILNDLLDDILGQSLYYRQFSLNNSREKVDFAIKIPSSDNNQTYFPIDAKFPMSSYEDLLLAKENNNKEAIEKATKALSQAIEIQAKEIKKYIQPPLTTSFAAMYLPTEGLYAEVISIPGIQEKIRKQANILIMGPSITAAWLSVLKVGFQTVSIQKKSTEIMSAFIKFKKDFSLIIQEIEKAKKSNDQISKSLEEVTKKTGQITNQIDKINSIEDSQLELIDE